MIKKIIFTTSLFSILSACGGGGSSDSNEPVSISVRSLERVATEETPYSFSPTLLSGSGDITYSVANKPAWLDFDQSTGVLSGTPDDDDVGIHSGIIVTATNAASSSSYGPFSITVNGINDAPEISDQTITLDNFNVSNTLSLAINDNDHTNSQLELMITDQPAHGTVTVNPSNASLVTYQANLLNAKEGDSFKVKLSDGELESDEAEIQIQFSDTTPASITTLPGEGALNVSTSAKLILSSDDPFDVDTLTYNSVSGACTGYLQVSSDGFTNCIGISDVNVDKLATFVSILFIEALEENTEYQIRLSSDIKSVFDASYIVSDSSFQTANGLLITEVSECFYFDYPCWFEVYNPTSSTIDLSTYQLQSTYRTQSDFFYYNRVRDFSLPNRTVLPGQYVVVRSDRNGDLMSQNNRVFYIHDNDFSPFWLDNGYINLTKDGVSKDLIVFNDQFSPSEENWVGPVANAPRSELNKFGSSIGRNGSNADTNTAADWTRYETATLGGPNDVQCLDDLDQDGIPDCSEQPGSTFAGLPLYDWGARAGQKDIFIEIDYMDATNNGAQPADAGITPRKEALQKVKDVFASRGIVVHFDVGDLYDPGSGINPDEFNLGGGDEVPFQNQVDFDNQPTVYDYKLDHFDYARFQIFHYALFANTIEAGSTIGGQAEILGNDMIISLGDMGLNTSTPEQENKLINYQAVTLMHELGHNLGLQHGGFEEKNYKANYVSVMNYLYSFNGLPEIGKNEGDRLYNYFYDDVEDCAGTLTNSFESDSFVMDFSDGDAINLNAYSLNETLGLGFVDSTGVDYNCDGDSDDTQVNFAQNFPELNGTWSDHDDWSNIKLGFYRYAAGSRNLSLESDKDTEMMPDKVGDDRSPVAKEYGFSPRSRSQQRAHTSH
ncbi:hypothetical protein HF888_01065 [Bermanella marisrubri]|uniref:Fibronectin type III domain protein n=1 Tax=Bermanella marisrubri TaxID=207949 RepID=Q1N4A0_9GAMM|nr:Ig-like domain-containing protein [Bermanella marisrubri]EAT12965.1 fibronectin type III domain protein [Oceanobacter sp. RED65] [Bermanella marisrubri]QIZ82907.1 hypothetical protein HF888_01065 [Bermanella marisrubri]